jgi:hypothetical protein
MLVYKLLEIVLCGLIKSATLTVDAIAGSAGSSATLAFSEKIRIPKSVWNGEAVTIKVPLYHIDDYGQYEGCCRLKKSSRRANLYVKLKWTTFDPTRSFGKICSPVCRPSASAVELPVRRKTEMYDEFSGYDIAEREGLEEVLLFIKNKYDSDKLRPRNISAFDPPPINRIHAIYGVNLPTEVGCVYSRQDTCLSDGRLQSSYVPDKKATLRKDSGYAISRGLIMETPETKQTAWGDIKVCGDGTVPYWSLAHVKTWKSDECEVTVQELDKSPHREILADPRFHKALLDYVCIDETES